MSKFKKFSLFCLSAVLALTFLITSFPLGKPKATKQTTSAVGSQLVDNNMFNYIKLSIAGKPLTTENIKSVDTNDDGKADTSYIITNDKVTLTFNPLKYSYKADFNNAYFSTSASDYIESDKIPKGDDGNFPLSFTINGTEYTYQVMEEGKVSIKPKNSSVTLVQTADFVKIIDTENTRKLRFIVRYALNAEADISIATFGFTASTTNATANGVSYSLNFMRTVQDFDENDPFVYFTFTYPDADSETPAQKYNVDETSYENLKLEFQNNDYTEINPLYFNINYNGFVYTYKLYSKEINSAEYLFVDYYDEQRQNTSSGKINDKSLATEYDSKTNQFGDRVVTKYKSGTEFNKFTIDFKYTGRYEIEIYDSTYLLLGENSQDENRDKISYNYYSTSFYIKTKEGVVGGSSSAYDNAYAIMQSYDDNRNFLDYIVSTSTQNTNVQITVKNLAYYLEKDEVFSTIGDEDKLDELKITQEDLEQLDIIKFTKGTLLGSTNEPDNKFYTFADIKELFQNSSSKEKNFTLNCEDDGIYAIYIYKYEFISERNTLGEIESTRIVKSAEREYQFTIVKKPKISYTVYEVNGDNDPIKDSTTGAYKTKLHEATTPYKTVAETYKINIDDTMEFSWFFSGNTDTSYNETLEKTYLNTYTINYAMQMVLAERVTIYEEGSNQNERKVLGLRFYGVGNITVNVTLNSNTTNYNLSSGSTLIFEDYGVYKVSITDSMGTSESYTFSYKKPVSVSAIIMIVLVCVIVLVIVLFVISSRGKVATR